MESYVKAKYDFSGEIGTHEISISLGEVLQVTRTDIGDGWWEGKKLDGSMGLFPAAYVEAIPSQEVRNHLSQGMYGCTDRYDRTEECLENDEWEDDWDDDNETYSVVGKGEVLNYETKNLPALPVDHSKEVFGNHSTSLKKSIFTKGSDSYILGLSHKEKLADREIVNIIFLDNFFYWQFDGESYSVLVTSPKKETKFKGMKTFIAYQLTPSFTNISVSRRYKHFDWLHERLIEKFCLIPIPPLPDKQISGRYEEQFVEHRRVQLQEFVDWVCRHPVLSKCEVWHHFLTCKDEKAWKLGKRKAEKDTFVGISYCLAIVAPEKQLLPSILEAQIDSSSQLINSMEVAIRNLLTITNENAKRFYTQSKKDFNRFGEALLELSKALQIDELRTVSETDSSLSISLKEISAIYVNLGNLFGEQPKMDLVPFSDRLHIYRGIINCFPDIMSTHKTAQQKRKDFEKLVADQKLTSSQLNDVNRRIDVISYAVLAELSHFKKERETHLKQTLKSFVEEQIRFYSNVVDQLKKALNQID